MDSCSLGQWAWWEGGDRLPTDEDRAEASSKLQASHLPAPPSSFLSIIYGCDPVQRQGVRAGVNSLFFSVFIGESEKVKVAQSRPTLWDPTDYNVHGILLVRILAWVAFPFSGASSQSRDWTQVFHTAGGFFTSWATGERQRSPCNPPFQYKTRLTLAQSHVRSDQLNLWEPPISLIQRVVNSLQPHHTSPHKGFSLWWEAEHQALGW